MGHGSTDVRFVTRVVNRENPNALAGLLDSDAVKVVVGETYPLSDAADRVTHLLRHP